MPSINIANATVEQLKQVGGREWAAPNGSIRLYFNNLPELFGFELTYYGTGNLCTAKLDGAAISNSQAKKYLADLATMKAWVEGGRLHTRLQFRPQVNCDYAAALTEGVNARLAALATA